MNARSQKTLRQDSLVVFGRVLRDYGYWEACRLHRNCYIDRRYLPDVKANRHAFSAETQALIDLLICWEPVALSRLAFVPPGVVDELVEEGVLAPGDNATVASSYSVTILEDRLLFTEDMREPDHSVYFGEDSEFLANMLEIVPGARCLDLCAGTCVQALVSLSRGAACVDAVEINPRAVRLGRLNGRLNAVADRLVIYEGDMFGPLPQGRTYDRIVCNPPLLPIPPDTPYPLCGDGGPDGLHFTRTILSNLDSRLADEGKCLLLGLSPSGRTTAVEDLCKRWCVGHLTYALYILARQPINEYTKQVALTASTLYSQQNALKVARLLKQFYRDAGVDAVVSYYLSVRRTTATAPSGVYDLTHGNCSTNYWFVRPRQ